MADDEDWAGGVDIERPSTARMYDYYLGGSHNFTADREAARTLMKALPHAPLMAQANRGFLRRAVQFLVGAGIRQILDVGSGIPTYGNVHEIAQSAAPDTRVVYVDMDPVAVSHGQYLLAGNERATAVQSDLRDPRELLERVGDALDFTQPIALMLVAVLHFVPGEEAYEAVRVLCDTLPAGSYLVLSHVNKESFSDLDAGQVAGARRAYADTATPPGARTRADIERFFAGFELVEPGLVWVPQWRPDGPDDVPEAPERLALLGGVGYRKEV